MLFFERISSSTIITTMIITLKIHFKKGNETKR